MPSTRSSRPKSLRQIAALTFDVMPCSCHRSRICSSVGGRLRGAGGGQVSDTGEIVARMRVGSKRGESARFVDRGPTPPVGSLPCAGFVKLSLEGSAASRMSWTPENCR
jgi:hypothetical protein